jgi:hypothetical protein
MCTDVPVGPCLHAGRVDDERALLRLPVAYATALRLRAAGADDGLIARTLEIELDQLPLLIHLGEAKLRRARVYVAGADPRRLRDQEDI